MQGDFGFDFVNTLVFENSIQMFISIAAASRTGRLETQTNIIAKMLTICHQLHLRFLNITWMKLGC